MISTPPTLLQFGSPSSVSGGILSFISVRPPVATLIPPRPSSSDLVPSDRYGSYGGSRSGGGNGYGAYSGYSSNRSGLHWKEQLHDSTAPMMQTRYLFVGKSVGFNLEKSYSLAIHAYGAY